MVKRAGVVERGRRAVRGLKGDEESLGVERSRDDGRVHVRVRAGRWRDAMMVGGMLMSERSGQASYPEVLFNVSW